MAVSLDVKFAKAFKDLSEFEENLAPDVGEVDVRDAFKFNAWTQLNGMTQENAKKQYIKLVENIVNNQNK